MAKKNFYVVWKGRKPGIYRTWDECKEQTDGFKGASFKGFATEEEAKAAFNGNTVDKKETKEVKETKKSPVTSTYIRESISVDAACSGNPGVMEYRCVNTDTGKQLFYVGPFPKGTNNIGEFLGLVDGLRYLQEKDKKMPIYSDSKSAIAWVRNKMPNTNLVKDHKTKELWEKIDEAVKWPNENRYENPIYKWNTEEWGEIKADFGRK